MDALTFVAVLLVVGTVNAGLAMNFVSRRADRDLTRQKVYARNTAAHEDRELKRKTFNVEHARTLLLAGNRVNEHQSALVYVGA